MNTAHLLNRKLVFALGIIGLCLFNLTVPPASAQNKRPMTFMDSQEIRQPSSPAISPDGKWALYSLSVPDWKAAKRYTDVYLVSMDGGLASTRQMTFTKDKNEGNARWSRDGKFFVFVSDREAPASATAQNQLYLMRPDGGEARKITEAKDGVGQFAFSKDGKWLAFSAGKADEQQIWALPVAEIETAKPQQLTKHSTPITSWQFSPDSRRIYFVSPDTVDKANKERIEQKFTVRIRNEEPPLNHLWALDLDGNKESRLTSSPEYSVGSVTISDDSKWIGYTGTPKDRYQRTVTEAGIYADLYLLEAATGKIERLTNNKEIGESELSFSPDSKWIAFSASYNFEYFRNGRVNIRPVAGGQWKELGDGFDGDASVNFWSEDGKTIYFNEGWRATNQLFALSTETGKVAQVTNEKGVATVLQDDDTKRLVVSFSDSNAPTNYFVATSLATIGNRSSWKQLTDANPQIKNIALGETEAIQWKSSDGKLVEGVLVKPVNYERGKRYPLIVQIHGGPAGADVLRFNPGYGAQIYAGAGYAVLCPNYRGSTNYGEKHKMEIGGDYFRQGYDDIMTGVDHLIAQGLVDGDKMGAMGWSAGGHWSNWILTHTDRFKAISSGAGAVNWISMYAQSDVQRNREFYYGGKPPYEDFAKYWDVSPLKFIKNAKTPTLIHVVDGDPRVPRPQSEELHMALKKLGVPTEFMVYPGTTHGITDPRNQLVKAIAEFNWFEKWIRGKQGWLDWQELLKTVKDDKADAKKDVKRTEGSGSEDQ
ncbi:MAG TPA: S9 family peptidase [Blastocatellia bacterium]|nr:S9 family peptidase [Blastocatellia bacterium]